MKLVSVATLFLMVAVTACTPKQVAPDIAALYNREAQAHEAERNPVIVIPGILGSKLRDQASGKVVWGAFDSTSADPYSTDGARLIALPMQIGRPLNAATDTVSPNGVLDTVRLSLWGLPIELQAYASILNTLGAGGYRDSSLNQGQGVSYGKGHFTCFQFPYDWRRDISYNAALLDIFIREKKLYVEKELFDRYGVKREVKFDIVAHSMGGLLARYYLQYGANPLPDNGAIPNVSWEGAKLIDNLVLVGTPNGGSIKSFEQLLEGSDYGPFVPKYDKSILGTMPAVYELLPRARHAAYLGAVGTDDSIEDILDPALWIKYGWGLADPANDENLKLILPSTATSQERLAIAIDHLKKCLSRARQFQDAMDRPVTLPSHVRIALFVGDAVPTPTVARINLSDGSASISGMQPGDGTVSRASVLLDERTTKNWTPLLKTPLKWSQVNFVFNDHLGMTRDPSFTDSVLFSLLEYPLH